MAAISLVYTGKKQGAKFLPDSPKAFSSALAAFKDEQKIDVVFRQHQEKRSSQQNRMWWGLVVRAFAEFMGYRTNSKKDMEYVHEQVLIELGHYEEREAFGKIIKVPLETKNLEKKEFSDLFDAAQQLGAGYGVFIPDPESMQAKSLLESYKAVA